jgi:hypothetical protein
MAGEEEGNPGDSGFQVTAAPSAFNHNSGERKPKKKKEVHPCVSANMQLFLFSH